MSYNDIPLTKGNTMNTIENDLVAHAVIIQLLENQRHVWSNKLAFAAEIRHDDDAERIQLVLDSIDMEIDRQREQIKYIGSFYTRPFVKE